MYDLVDLVNIIDIHFASLAICIAILLYVVVKHELVSRQQKMFFILVIVTIFSVLTEMLGYLFTPDGYIFTYLFFALSYVGCAAIAYLWLLYVYVSVCTNQSRFKQFIIFSSIPLIINSAIVLTNPLTNLSFTLDNDLTFTRGPFFGFLSGAGAFYILYSIYVILKFKKTTDPTQHKFLILFAVLPSIGVAFQVLFYGVNTIWISICISILIIYLNIQNQVIYIDFLTNANNRRSFQQYLHSKMDGRASSDFSAFLLDVDEFKYINDTFGHHFGDKALQQTVAILQEAFGEDSYICRYGGDEFVVITDEIILEDEAKEMIHKELDKFNDQSDSFKLNFSLGGEVYRQSSGVSEEQLLKNLDRKMYFAKRTKSFARRDSDSK